MTNNRVIGVKKSQFIAGTTVSGSATFDYVESGQNIKITFADLINNLGVTGTLEQGGDPLGTPVLDPQGSVNVIRNIEPGFGITTSITPQNGLEVATDFSFDQTGVPIVEDASSSSPNFRSLVAGFGTSITGSGGTATIDVEPGEFTLESVALVKEPEDLSGVLDSTKLYVVDGLIDFSGTGLFIEVPIGGLSIAGVGLEVSGLSCSDAGYTLFRSAAGGDGGLVCRELTIEVSGTGSQVYDLVNGAGIAAINHDNIRWQNCTSLGTLDGYIQGVERATARNGGTPELKLAGAWFGYFVDSSVVRNITDGPYTLYSAGAGFAMASRFRTNQNVDLPASVSLLDFTPAAFPNPSTLQIIDAIVTRNGVSDASDPNYTPNITASDLASSWRNNVGISNTFVGGTSTITGEVTTTITVAGDFEDLAGTYTATDLQHFDAPASGQLRHLGISPREYRVTVSMVLDSSSNDEVDLKIVIFRDATTSFEDGATQRRVINNLQGGRDVAYFNLFDSIILNQNDYVKLQVANVADINDITAELTSKFIIEER